MKVALSADQHSGKKGYGLSVAEWIYPLKELVQKAIDNGAYILCVAGDLFDKRDPSVEAVSLVDEYLGEFNGQVLISTGNHELRAPDTNNAMYLMKNSDKLRVGRNYGIADLFRIYSVTKDGKSYHIGILNWATLEFFPDIDKSLPLPEQLEIARHKVMDEIKAHVKERNVGQLDLIMGHAHIYSDKPEENKLAPNLLAGRDILLPEKELMKLCSHLYLGHIHTSSVRHYIGSLQPTDRSDTEKKGFYILDLDTDEVTRHYLNESLKMTKLTLSGVSQEGVLQSIKDQIQSEGISKREYLYLVLDNSALEDQLHYDYMEIRDFALKSGYYKCEINLIPMERKARVSNKDGVAKSIPECVEDYLLSKGYSADKIKEVNGVLSTLVG